MCVGYLPSLLLLPPVNSSSLGILEMADLKSGIRYCLLYDFKRGKTAAESRRDLCVAFGQDVISERQCQRWFHKFRKGMKASTSKMAHAVGLHQWST
ncbi:hypothetical protein ANCDUO_16838 [Ancylostoma duodenale]|uniref:Mos1 transposase HTH domain-containing protein n=1 Tax=Ancylostoma duodenale TaxID=51022 RepID=A0A0C2FWV0_9BILA|nr:hypothetical protein ANCDUO_16838 [Ancylostoma duodenale]